jgi:5'-nucleotidase
LEEGVSSGLQPFQVSATLSYTWHSSAPSGDRVDPAEVLINGVPLDVGADYLITTNSFLSGGDGNHPILESATDTQTVAVDIDALPAYVESSSPIAPPALGRITVVP